MWAASSGEDGGRVVQPGKVQSQGGGGRNGDSFHTPQIVLRLKGRDGGGGVKKDMEMNRDCI